ncbi:MAG: hypothetical protein ACPL7R_06120, partial [Anaerolineae bacterium]
FLPRTFRGRDPIREIMVRNGDANKPIWATEVGWNAVPPDFPKPAIYGRVTPEQQARYAVEAYRRAQAEWPWMGVMNYWFFRRATDTETGEVFYYFRMVEPDFTPLPVYDAMRQLTAEPPKVYAGWHQEDHWALAYSGRWVDVPDARATLDSYRRSEGDGQVRFRFVGTGLDLVVVKGPDAGAIRVFVDGREVAVVNLHAETDMPAAIVPVAHNLRSGEHEAAIYATNGAGLDGLIVTNRPGTYAARKALGLAAVAVAALGLLAVPFQTRRRR